jgi:hypothetical protein
LCSKPQALAVSTELVYEVTSYIVVEVGLNVKPDVEGTLGIISPTLTQFLFQLRRSKKKKFFAGQKRIHAYFFRFRVITLKSANDSAHQQRQ